MKIFHFYHYFYSAYLGIDVFYESWTLLKHQTFFWKRVCLIHFPPLSSSWLGEYLDITGEALNYQKYGFTSIQEFLSSAEDIVIKQTQEGPLCYVTDAKMSHVTDLVQKAKVAKVKSSNYVLLYLRECLR